MKLQLPYSPGSTSPGTRFSWRWISLRLGTENSRARLAIAYLCPLAIFLGLLNAWVSGHEVRDPALSYIDMSDAFRQHDWSRVVNGQWSPLFPFLVSLAMGVLNPSPYWEFAVVHLVDLVSYLGALACFHFLLTELIRYQRFRSVERLEENAAGFPEWCWWMLGYTLFIWSALLMIARIPAGTPDMCVAAFVYLAAGILLRIRTGAATWLSFALLGLVLGLGYLAKAAMFPMAFVFLVVGFFSISGVRRAALRVLLALCIFLTIASPLVAALSRQRGRLTFGDAGRLAYAWLVNGVTPYVHWQGGSPGTGVPKHPTRKICDAPAIYEFATPIQATYPPMYDPAYWYDGLVVRFDSAKQLRALAANSKIYFNLFLRQGELIAGFLTLFLFSDRGWLRLKNLAAQWTLLVPALAALLMYWQVYVEWRYVGPFLVLLWLGVFSSIRLPDSNGTRRLLVSLATAMSLFMMIEISGLMIHEVFYKARPWAVHRQWEVAHALRGMGIQPGEKVAWIRSSAEPLWARVGRFRVVAEMPPEEADYFWAGDAAVKLRALRSFAATGAKAIVAEKIPGYASAAGWQEIGSTGYRAYLPRVISNSNTLPSVGANVDRD